MTGDTLEKSIEITKMQTVTADAINSRNHSKVVNYKQILKQKNSRKTKGAKKNARRSQ